ncbi:hypothetical protein AGMMS49975_01460 [Clostridia bacterium]|nr:hypothetical protein AGMMS49975_01460 [Clostridia bacterium]
MKKPDNNKIRDAACLLASVAVVIMILAAAVFTPAFDRNFYFKEYEKNGTYAQVGVSEADMERVTDVLIGYMRNEGTLEVSVPVNGVVRPFFSEREILHMDDVRNLMNNGLLLRNICIIYLMAMLVYMFPKKFTLCLPKIFVYNNFAAIAFVLVMGLMALNFEGAFTAFHKIFFNNDLWILDPNVDLLINIVPFQFFTDMALRIGSAFVYYFALAQVLMRFLINMANKAKKEEVQVS